jgi:hypothetical protein
MEYKDEDLKLIFVLKIGYNTKGEGQYEFVFSIDDTNIDVEKWCWDLEPACDNAVPPEEEYINGIYNLRTDSFDLFCLHEAVDRPYMHGYHTIHALAYEIDYQGEQDGFEEFEEMFDDEDAPLLVFHYGMTLAQIKEMLYERKIILKGTEFLESSKVNID